MYSLATPEQSFFAAMREDGGTLFLYAFEPYMQQPLCELMALSYRLMAAARKQEIKVDLKLINW